MTQDHHGQPERRTRRKPSDGAGKPAPSSLSPDVRYRKGLDAAFRLLSNRERSAAELRKRLREKGYPEDTVEKVLERLQETGLQDDPRFADRYAAESAVRGKAARLIQRELVNKGLDKELAAAAATVSPEDERERARSVAEKKARTMRGVAQPKRLQRLAGLLARRGFDPETCWVVAKEFATEAALDDEEPSEEDLDSTWIP